MFLRHLLSSLSFLTLLLLSACAPPTPPRPPKQPSHPSIGPLLRLLMNAHSSFYASSSSRPTFLSQMKPFITTRINAGHLEIRALLEFTGSPDELQKKGYTITSSAGPIYSVWIPFRNLSHIKHLKGLQIASLGRPLSTHLNLSSVTIRAPQARLKYSLDGRGVIVGIIDTGIDISHPSFRHANGKTRLLYLLDYSLPSSGKKGAKPPRLFTQKEIDEALRRGQRLEHRDTYGHGTHIAGIAAGNGQLSLGGTRRYIGIAPRADLIVVKALRKEKSNFNSADVLDGITFIHNKAKKLKRPYVINLSLGGHHGGHEGRTLLERAINVFSGPRKNGQIIVASAGNEGNHLIHTEGWVSPEEAGDIVLIVPPYDKEKKFEVRALVEIWYDFQDNLQAYVITPSGQQIGPYNVTQGTRTPLLTKDGLIALQHDIQYILPARKFITILLTNFKDTPLASGRWRIRLKGNAHRFDAWISSQKHPKGRITFERATRSILIGVPGACSGVLTVGSFNSRRGWLNAYHLTYSQPFEVGALSSFSSPGPTRDGRPKPEISAPGIFVAAPASKDASPAPTHLVSDGFYFISQGTSQAAPHLTGAVALLLQENPYLDTEEIRHLLMRSAQTDSYTNGGHTYDPHWGFGKLDILSLLRTAHQFSLQPPDPQRSTFGTTFSNLPANGKASTTIYIVPKDANGQSLTPGQTVQVRTTHGKLSPVIEFAPALYKTTLTSSTFPTIASLSAWINGVRLSTTLKISFTPPLKKKFAQGCSCQQQTNTSSSLPLLFLLLLFLNFIRISYR